MTFERAVANLKKTPDFREKVENFFKNLRMLVKKVFNVPIEDFQLNRVLNDETSVDIVFYIKFNISVEIIGKVLIPAESKRMVLGVSDFYTDESLDTFLINIIFSERDILRFTDEFEPLISVPSEIVKDNGGFSRRLNETWKSSLMDMEDRLTHDLAYTIDQFIGNTKDSYLLSLPITFRNYIEMSEDSFSLLINEVI